jgi:hypothetical protein
LTPVACGKRELGVAEYEACINTKIPEDQRQFHRKILDEKQKGWIEYVNAYPSLKSSLEQTCNTTMTVTNMTLLSYGCSLH